MKLKRLGGIALSAALLAACAEVTQAGSRAYSKLPGNYPVTVFTTAAEAPRQYELVAHILYPDFGRPETYDITRGLNTIRAKARDFGGNGVIIDGKEEVPSGFFAGGTLVRARAIRFGPLLVTDQSSPAGSLNRDRTLREALLELDRLRQDRLISDQEYRTKREEILARL